MLLLRQQCSS